MLELATMGADAPETVVPGRQARTALIVDLAKASRACQKSGIDISDPIIKSTLIAAGGSAMALAAQIGPKKTLNCIRMFTAIAERHKPYILLLERNYREMVCFARQLRRAIGPAPVGTKKKAAVSASMGAWGTLLALGALGGAIFFVTKAFAKKDDTSPEDKLKAAPAAGWTTTKLKDAADRKFISAKMSVSKDPVTGATLTNYVGIRDGKEFKITCTPDKVPVWSGLRWTCMPHAMAAKVAMAGHLKGIGARDLTAKDAEGVETCGVDSLMGGGSLEEIVGELGYDFVGARRRRKARRPRRRRRKRGPRIPGEVPADTIPRVRPRRPRIRRMNFSPLVLSPGPVSPMNKTLPAGLAEILDIIQNSPTMAAVRARTAAVTNRRWPVMWPGSRGAYSY